MDETDTERRSLSGGEWAAVILAVLVVAGAVWLWFQKPSSEQPAPQPTAAEGVQQPSTAQEQPPATPLTDAQVKAWLEALGNDPAYRRWLAAAEEIVRRWAVVTDNLAEGVSPRKALELAAPKGAFRVVQHGGKTFLSPESCARYDQFAGAVASVDAQAFAGAYRAVKPTVEAAYRALGYPSGSLDAVTARALRRLEGAPVVEGEVELVPERGLYLFADPKLEGATQVDKHLLRMGPGNTRLIQGKAREIREALALPAEAASAK